MPTANLIAWPNSATGPDLAKSKAHGELYDRGFVLNVMAQASWQRGDRQRASSWPGSAPHAPTRSMTGRLGILPETFAWMAAQ